MTIDSVFPFITIKYNNKVENSKQGDGSTKGRIQIPPPITHWIDLKRQLIIIIIDDEDIYEYI